MANIRFVTRRARWLASLFVAATIAAVGTGAQAPDRSKPPVPGPPPSLKLPPIQKHTLSNGLTVWIAEMHKTPVVDFLMVVKSGGGDDPPGKFGLAGFTAAMLDEGAGSRSALELADAVEFLGASLQTTSSFDASRVNLHTIVSKLDLALPLFADVVARPTFPQTEVDRIRKERLTTLLQMRDNAAQLASAAFNRLLFGAMHRYGTPIIGNDALNTQVTVQDLKQFYATHYQPSNATLIVTGDVTASVLVPKLEAAFSGWRNGPLPASRPALPVTASPTSRTIYLVDKPGAAQSQIRMGSVGVTRTTPDYFAIDVLNTILGGSFASRLNQNLREEHGYTYGASSTFDMRKTPGPFLAGAGVQTDKTAESLVEFFKELDGIRAPIPADELARGRNLQALSFPGSFETTSAMASQLADLVVYGLPESFFTDYVPKIQAVSSGDLARIAQQYIQVSRLVVVVVGDVAKIEAPIRAKNFGLIRKLTVEEVLK